MYAHIKEGGGAVTEKSDLERLAVTTKAKRLFRLVDRWGGKCPFWFLPVGTSCCSLEYQAALGFRHNPESFEPTPAALADIMIVMGTVTEKQLPIITQIYHKMPYPKWVIALGACASGGGPYASYNVVQGIDREIPVDVYVPGCPPTPESIITAIEQVRERVQKGISAAKGLSHE